MTETPNLNLRVADDGRAVLVDGLAFRRADETKAIAESARESGWMVDVFEGDEGFVSCLVKKHDSYYSISFGGRRGIIEFIVVSADGIFNERETDRAELILNSFHKIADAIRKFGSMFPISAQINYRTLCPELRIL